MKVASTWSSCYSENVVKLKDEFNIKNAVITGVGYGGDAELYGHHFSNVFGVDIDETTLKIARKRLSYLKNVHLLNMKSVDFIKLHEAGWWTTLFYLDAHYFDPNLKQKWVVVDELKALKGSKDAIIVLHDYDNGELGHLIYSGEPLNWNVVAAYLHEVNPDFHYYTNTRAMCDIYNEKTIKKSVLHVDEYILDGLRYANTSDVKKYRGILYAVPRELDISKYQLKEGHG